MKRGYLLRIHKAVVGDGFEERGIRRHNLQSAGRSSTTDELFTGMFGHWNMTILYASRPIPEGFPLSVPYLYVLKNTPQRVYKTDCGTESGKPRV